MVLRNVGRFSMDRTVIYYRRDRFVMPNKFCISIVEVLQHALRGLDWILPLTVTPTCRKDARQCGTAQELQENNKQVSN
jgi:hypothetical protein